MKVIRGIGRWFVQHINLVLLLLIIFQCILFLHSSLSGVYTQREYERQKIQNQIAIEKVQTEKEIAILEAQKEAEVTRIKSGAVTEDAP